MKSDTLSKHLGLAIKKRRKSMGFSQAQLAEKAKIDIKLLQRLEKGEVILDKEILELKNIIKNREKTP